MTTGASLAELRAFRQDLYGTFTRWGDALFELADALLSSAGPVGSIPALSLEAEFTRSHGSLYKALSKGRIDADGLRRLLAGHRGEGWPLTFAVDASTWPRCDAECSPGRGLYYSASRHSAGQPIVAGRSYQWISQLCITPDSWSAPMDVVRLPLDADATTATIGQVTSLVALLPGDRQVPLFVFDAGYDAAGLSDGLRAMRAEVLVRIAETRVFHPDPPERQAPTTGRPRRHGDRFVLADPKTWTKPDARASLCDPRYGAITVTAWHGLRPGSTAGDAGRTATSRRSCAAVSSASRLPASRRQQREARRHSGCGGPGPACPTSSAVSSPTCGVLTSSTASDS
jgi:hypothetical protein